MVADTVMQTREEGYIANGQEPSLVAFSRAVLAFTRGLALSVVQRKTFTQIFEKMDANSDGALAWLVLTHRMKLGEHANMSWWSAPI